MATIYLDSTATGAADGTSWTDAYTTLAALISGGLTSADLILVEDGHTEALGATTDYVFPEDPGLRMICVDEAAETTPKTGATWTTTGDMRIGLDGSVHGFGLSFIADDSAGSSSVADVILGVSANFETSQVWDSCVFGTQSTNAGAHLFLGLSTDSGRIQLINCTWTAGAVTQSIQARSDVLIQNLTLGAAVTSLFESPSQSNGRIVIENSDLSTNGPTNLLSRTADSGLTVIVRNCKLPVGVSLATGSSDRWSADRIEVFNSDSADTNYRYASDYNEGTVDTETTITRTGGAKHDGTQYSFKMVSSANSEFAMPLESPEFVIWNETLSEITVTVKTTVDTTALQDDEIWLEVQYLGTSGFPKGSSITDRMTLLGTPANQTVEAEDWDSSPTSPQDQNLAVTFTPQEVGFIHCKVMLAKPSITVYVDPLPVIS